jgi:hypothetical protein
VEVEVEVEVEVVKWRDMLESSLVPVYQVTGVLPAGLTAPLITFATA